VSLKKHRNINQIVDPNSIFLNPELNTSCTYLQKYVYYCVQPVGSISTYSGHPGSTTDNFSKVSMTSVPSSESRPDYANPSSQSNSRPVIWLAKDTRKDCYEYLKEILTAYTSLNLNQLSLAPQCHKQRTRKLLDACEHSWYFS
jgi:hypothetical protein